MQFMNIVEKLSVNSDPDYNHLISILNACLKENHFDIFQPDFTWNKLEKSSPFIKLDLFNPSVEISADYEGDYGEVARNLLDQSTGDHCKWLKTNS